MSSLNPHYEVEIGKEKRELFMSFGLLTTLSDLIADPANCTLVSIDPKLRMDVLSALLAERKPSGKIIKPVEDIDDIEITMEEAEDLLNWATEHVLSFFVRSMERSAKILEKHQGAVAALESSVNGSGSSASKTA